MKIPFTQYLRPNGDQRELLIECPPDLEDFTSELLKHRVNFNVEQLTTGHLSMTAEDQNTIDEHGPLAMEICGDNEQDGPPALRKLIVDAYSRFQKQRETLK